MSDTITVLNEMVGVQVPIATHVEARAQLYFEARDVFLRFAQVHNAQNPTSARVYVELMNNMDATKESFLPFENLWYIAHKGYSLN